MSPSEVARPAFFAALASPLLRRIVLASSKLPLASSRAALQSIMPAPVWSRSFFTSAALIAMVISYEKNAGPPERKAGVDRGESKRLLTPTPEPPRDDGPEDAPRDGHRRLQRCRPRRRVPVPPRPTASCRGRRSPRRQSQRRTAGSNGGRRRCRG